MLDDLHKAIGEVLHPMPAPADHWVEFKKLAIAAEQHRRECLFRESGAGQATTDAAASDSLKNQAQITEEAH